MGILLFGNRSAVDLLPNRRKSVLKVITAPAEEKAAKDNSAEPRRRLRGSGLTHNAAVVFSDDGEAAIARRRPAMSSSQAMKMFFNRRN